jgi:hypothetical protein
MAILIDGDKSRQVSREELDAAGDKIEHLGAGIYRVKIKPAYSTKVMRPKKD